MVVPSSSLFLVDNIFLVVSPRSPVCLYVSSMDDAPIAKVYDRALIIIFSAIPISIPS